MRSPAEIAPHHGELLADPEPLCYSPRHGQHIQPVDRTHSNVSRSLSEGNAPDARARGEIEHGDWPGRLGKVERICQHARRRIT